MSTPNTYTRPIAGWWRRNPFYRAYILRELTCVAVIVFALELLVGLWRLVQGPEAFDAWRASLAQPWVIVVNCVVLALVAWHAWTWFEVMPKTLPFINLGGRRVPDRAIVAAGAIAAVVASLVVLFLFLTL
ncbi:MAG TPA: fumarate reductase subunit C [Burkholderiaceae bacterium]|nr:fumarate reductase subunit C [Burkholderiaceae bacterium]